MMAITFELRFLNFIPGSLVNNKSQQALAAHTQHESMINQFIDFSLFKYDSKYRIYIA